MRKAASKKVMRLDAPAQCIKILDKTARSYNSAVQISVRDSGILGFLNDVERSPTSTILFASS